MTDHTVAPNTSVGVYAPDEDETKWTVSGDLRAPGSGWSGEENYAIADELRPQFPGDDSLSNSTPPRMPPTLSCWRSRVRSPHGGGASTDEQVQAQDLASARA